MPNGNPNLDDYFPGGSTAVDTIKNRINNEIQRGTLQINSAVLTLEDLRTITSVEQKIATKRYKIGLAVAIILWIASIFII